MGEFGGGGAMRVQAKESAGEIVVKFGAFGDDFYSELWLKPNEADRLRHDLEVALTEIEAMERMSDAAKHIRERAAGLR